MAHADVRIALSAGLISAALTIGGPCIGAASADPGHSGSSHSKHGDSSRDRRHDRDGQSGTSRDNARAGDRDDDRRGDDGFRRGGDSYQRGDDRDGWESRTGWEGRYGDVPAKSDYEGPGGYQVASRPNAQPSTTSRNTAITGDATPNDTPPSAEPGGGGSVPQGGVAAPVGAPRVTFGNGRTPGVLKTAPGGTVIAVNPAPASAAPAPPPPAPESPSAALMAIEPESQEFIDRIWAPLRPTFGSGLLFGLAGLVLMPLSGVWLGYRQARAAKAATKLVSH